MIDENLLPDGLLSYLQSEEQRSLDASLNEERKIALDFYHGRPFGDEVEGRSQLVTRDVAEVVDAMTVAIMRTVVSDKVVEFEARELLELPEVSPQEDPVAWRAAVQAASRKAQDRAQDATALVAWQFMRAQSGYRIAHDCLKAGLLEKTGVFKTWAEPTYEVVDGEALASEIDADDTIIAAEPIADEFVMTEAGFEQVFHVRRRVPGKVKYRDEAVPNEEFRFSPEARELDEAGYIQHRTRRSLAALMADYGLTEDEANTLWDNSNDAQSLADARDQGRGRLDSDIGWGAGLSRLVWVSEEYVRWDIVGDGVEKLICVHRVGRHVLSVVEVDEQPFVIWCPFPMPHRIVGQSLADKTMDIQRIRSVLLRQAMDALYFANAPRPYIDMASCDENTIDDVLSIVPGSPIRGRGPNSVQFLAQPFAAPHAFTALEFFTGERESRTGVTRHNQGLNADSLNMTATGYKLQADAGAQWEEYVARNYAEALAELFEKKLRLMKRYGAVEPVRTGGEFKRIDAREFEEEMDMTIRVGLGTGRKDARLAARMLILEQQKEGMAIGSPLVDNDKIYNSMAGIVADSGLGDPNMYVNDPAQLAQDGEGASEQKDPAVIEAEGKVALEQQKIQLQSEASAAQIQLKREEAAATIEAMRERHALEMAQRREAAALEAELARDRATAEADIAVYRIDREAEVKAYAASRQADAGGGIGVNREGGDLDK